MKGWLVVNHFINSSKFDEISRLLIVAAQDNHVKLDLKTNYELSLMALNRHTYKERPDFVLFWDKDIYLARLLEAEGSRLFNTAEAIDICDDKSRTYIHLKHSDLRMPNTMIIPKIYHGVDWGAYDIIGEAEETFGYPMILKEGIGSFGDQVYLIRSREELVGKMNSIGNRPMILQEFIQSSKGRDIRVYIVGNQVVAALYRYSVTEDFRANLTCGAKMQRYEPNEKQIDMALKAVNCIGLDFAGVDILFGEDDEPILCEVNSNAHFKNALDCTGVNVAEHIIWHITKTIPVDIG